MALKSKLSAAVSTFPVWILTYQQSWSKKELCKTCHSSPKSPVIPIWIVAEEARIGEYGICVNDGKEDFDYLIAGEYHGEEIPEGFETRKIPAGLWAKFKCVGPLPGSMQSVNTAIWHEWLPSHSEYELSANIDIEFYSGMPMDDPHYQSEIWLPIKRK